MVEKAKRIGRLGGMYRHKIVASVCREMYFFHPVAAPLAMLLLLHTDAMVSLHSSVFRS